MSLFPLNSSFVNITEKIHSQKLEKIFIFFGQGDRKINLASSNNGEVYYLD